MSASCARRSSSEDGSDGRPDDHRDRARRRAHPLRAGPAQLGGAADPGHPLTRRHRADRRGSADRRRRPGRRLPAGVRVPDALGDWLEGALRDRRLRAVRRLHPHQGALHGVHRAGVRGARLLLRVPDRARWGHQPGRRLVAGRRRAQRRVPRGALGIGGHVRRSQPAPLPAGPDHRRAAGHRSGRPARRLPQPHRLDGRAGRPGRLQPIGSAAGPR